MSASDYLIGGNDEHGLRPPTLGKRTPIMPYLDRSIYEAEFNRPAKYYFLIAALRCGFRTIDIHTENADISISERVRRANTAGLSSLVTFAYNAFGSGYSFNSYDGFLTAYSAQSSYRTRSRELAEDIFMSVTNNSLQTNGRSVINLSIGVLDSVQAPSVLVEAGFMTNLREARLMLDPAWQKSIGFTSTEGVCDFLSVPYITEGNVTAYPTIGVGDESNYVKMAQYYLLLYGYQLAADGKFGSTTQAVVMDFQKDNGLTADGIIGRQTWAKLALPTPSAYVLKIDSRGSPVWYLQNKLLSKLYPIGNVDGDFGNRTLEGVIAFQSESGLTPDGVVGPLTWAALNTLSSPRN